MAPPAYRTSNLDFAAYATMKGLTVEIHVYEKNRAVFYIQPKILSIDLFAKYHSSQVRVNPLTFMATRDILKKQIRNSYLMSSGDPVATIRNP